MKAPAVIRVAVIFDYAADVRTYPAGTVRADLYITSTIQAVIEILQRRGCLTKAIPVGRSIQVFHREITQFSPDVVFNLCEGYAGSGTQEGNVAGLLELLGILYTGNPAATLHLCLRKEIARIILQAAGLRVPAGKVVTHLEVPKGIRFPMIAKAAWEDGSTHIEPGSVVSSPADLRREIARLRTLTHQPVLVEEYINGREFNVSVVGNQVLPISEISFDKLPKGMPRIVSRNGKWSPQTVEYRGTVPICPARIPEGLCRKLERASRLAVEALQCRDYARVDFRVDSRGRAFVLEINPNPDLSPDAGLARAAQAQGWTYETLVVSLLDLALLRSERNHANRPRGAYLSAGTIAPFSV